MIEKAYDRAKDILATNREKLEALAQSLLDNEVIFKEDVERILGARPFAPAASVLKDGVQEGEAENKPSTESEVESASEDAPGESTAEE